MTSEPTFQSDRAMIAPMTWLGHFRATLVLGLPLVGAQLAQMLINTTDVVMLGWYGTEELAAGVLATQAFFLPFMFGGGFAHAVVPIASQAEGCGDTRHVRRSVRMGLWIVAIYAAVVMPLLWNIESILVFLGQNPAIARMTGSYMHIAQWGMFPALGTLALRSFLSAVSRTQIILWATLAGTLSNGLLNYAFIFGNLGAPEMGLQGAAVASLISATAIFLVMLGWVLSRQVFSDYALFRGFWRPDWPDFFDILRLGFPIALTIIAEVGLFAAASLMFGWLGIVPLAAHGIALQIISLSFMIPLGLSTAATVRVGQAYARRDGEGMRRAAIASLTLSALIAAGAALIIFLAPETLVSLFLDKSNAKAHASLVLATAVPLLFVGACFQFVDGLQVTGVALLRGLKDTRTPMIMAIISYWFFGVPTAYLLGFVAGWNGVGIWMGLAIGLGGAAILLNGRYYLLTKRLSFT
nr:MATE family efflux transporter [Pseudohoeflea suaedae]